MNLASIFWLSLVAQDPVPSVEEIVRKIEERNRPLGALEAEIEVEGGFIVQSEGARVISQKPGRGRLRARPGEFAAWDLAFGTPDEQSVILSTIHAAEGSAFRVFLLQPSKRKFLTVAGRGSIATDYVTAVNLPVYTALLLDATLQPRSFLKGKSVVAREEDLLKLTRVVQIPFQKERVALTYWIGSDWMFRAVDAEFGEKKYRAEVKETVDVKGVRVPSQVEYLCGEDRVLYRFAKIRAVERVELPSWAQWKELPVLLPPALEGFEQKAKKEPSFEAYLGWATYLMFKRIEGAIFWFGLFGGDQELEHYVKLREPLERARELKKDSVVANESLALAYLGLGEEKAFRALVNESPTPLACLLAAIRDEEAGRGDDALAWLERPSEGLFDRIRTGMRGRLLLQKAATAREFLEIFRRERAKAALDDLEPPPYLEIEIEGLFQAKLSLRVRKGGLWGRTDEDCGELEAVEDPEIRLALARHWAKSKRWEKAEEEYLKVFRPELSAEATAAVFGSEGTMLRLGKRLLEAEGKETTIIAVCPLLLATAAERKDGIVARLALERVLRHLNGLDRKTTIGSFEAKLFCTAIARATRAGMDVSSLLTALLEHLPRAFFSDRPQVTPELLEAIRAVSGGDETKLFLLILERLHPDEPMLRDLGVDKASFRSFLRNRVDSNRAGRDDYESLAHLVASDFNSFEKRFPADLDEDMARLARGVEKFPDADQALEILGDFHYVGRQAYRKAADFYAKALEIRLDQGRMGSMYGTGGARAEWSRGHTFTLRLAIALRAAGDGAAGKKIIERFRTHPRASEYPCTDKAIADMLFLLDPTAALRFLVTKYAKERTLGNAGAVDGFLEEQGRHFEAYAWGVATGQPREKNRVQALLVAASETRFEAKIDPLLFEAHQGEEKLRSVEAEWRKGLGGAPAARDGWIAAQLAEALRLLKKGEFTINPAEDRSLIPFLRRLVTAGQAKAAAEIFLAACDKISNPSSYYPTLAELAGGDHELLYRLIAPIGRGLESFESVGLSPAQALALALTRIQDEKYDRHDFLLVADFVRKHPRDRDDLRSFLERGAERFPEEGRIWESLGDDHYAGGRFAEALPAFAQASECTSFGAYTGFEWRANHDKYAPEQHLPIKIAWAAVASNRKEEGSRTLDRFVDRLARLLAKQQEKKFSEGTDVPSGSFAFGVAYEMVGDVPRARRAHARGFRSVLASTKWKDLVPGSHFPSRSLNANVIRFAGLLERSREPILAGIVLELLSETFPSGWREEEKRAVDALLARLKPGPEAVVRRYAARLEGTADAAMQKRVEEWVARLRADSVEERDRAMAELSRLGPESAAALKNHVDDATIGKAVIAILVPWAKDAAVREIVAWAQ